MEVRGRRFGFNIQQTTLLTDVKLIQEIFNVRNVFLHCEIWITARYLLIKTFKSHQELNDLAKKKKYATANNMRRKFRSLDFDLTREELEEVCCLISKNSRIKRRASRTPQK